MPEHSPTSIGCLQTSVGRSSPIKTDYKTDEEMAKWFRKFHHQNVPSNYQHSKKFM